MISQAASARTGVTDTHVHVDSSAYRPIEQFTNDAATTAVDRAVLVEHFSSTDNTYIRRCLSSDPSRLRGVVLLPLRGDLTMGLEAIKADPLVCGGRSQVKEVSDLADLHDVMAVVHALGAHLSLHIPLDVLTSSAAREVFDDFPELPVRIEHFGLPALDQLDAPTSDKLFAVFGRTSIFTMISGMYAFASEPFPYPSVSALFHRYVRELGTSRLMWSGDWNRNDLDMSRSDQYYSDAIDLVTHELAFLKPAQIHDILWGTAERFYSFDGPGPSLSPSDSPGAP